MLRDRSPALVAGVGWAVVDILIAVTGQRFSTDYLTYGWQIVPWEVLRDDPFGSVWYLHIQPPLWNLVLGTSAWVSPLSDAITLQLVQIAFGAALAMLLADLFVRLRFAPLVAVGLALVATLNPEVLKGAFEPTYELATATLLVGCVWAAVRLAVDPRAQWLLVLAGFATAVVLTRSLYHPLLAIALVGVAAFCVRRDVARRALVVAVALPIVLAGGWMAKNEVLFDRFTMSSWVGMNLQRSTIPVLPTADLEAMLAAGDVSEVARIGPFGNYDLYRPVMPPCSPEHDHAALTTTHRFDTGGVLVPNFNYECFLPVFDQAGDDAWAVIGERPRVWVEARLWSLRTTFAVSRLPSESPSELFRALDLVYRVGRVDVVGSISTEGWGTPIYGTLAVDSRFGLGVAALAGGLGAAAVMSLLRLARRRAADPRWAVAAVLSGAAVVATIGIGAVGELGEQARFRTMADPLILGVGLAGALHLLAARFDLPWVHAAAPPEPERAAASDGHTLAAEHERADA